MKTLLVLFLLVAAISFSASPRTLTKQMLETAKKYTPPKAGK